MRPFTARIFRLREQNHHSRALSSCLCQIFCWKKIEHFILFWTFYHFILNAIFSRGFIVFIIFIVFRVSSLLIGWFKESKDWKKFCFRLICNQSKFIHRRFSFVWSKFLFLMRFEIFRNFFVPDMCSCSKSWSKFCSNRFLI